MDDYTKQWSIDIENELREQLDRRIASAWAVMTSQDRQNLLWCVMNAAAIEARAIVGAPEKGDEPTLELIRASMRNYAAGGYALVSRSFWEACLDLGKWIGERLVDVAGSALAGLAEKELGL
jgi:hypothetical protein